jgi:PAP2 superfamily protein
MRTFRLWQSAGRVAAPIPSRSINGRQEPDVHREIPVISVTANGRTGGLFPAPNHPSYPAAHGCGDGAAEAVLSYLFPRDAAYFKVRAEEGALSRIWAGIHFRSDIDAGLALGRSVGRLTVEQAMKDDAM